MANKKAMDVRIPLKLLSGSPRSTSGAHASNDRTLSYDPILGKTALTLAGLCYTPPMSETLFILGREPEFSVAELASQSEKWQAQIRLISPEVAFVRHQSTLNPNTLQFLGGSLKQVQVVDHWSKNGQVVSTLTEKLTWEWLEQYFPARVEFGISLYAGSRHDQAAVQRHSLWLKKQAKAAGRPVRVVVSKEPQLSAVAVQRNGLLKNGKEFVLVVDGNEIIVGVTAAVQDYQMYGLRDFGRPAADPKSGMVPPKLAQMMLNIAQTKSDDIVLDPFCGSGTILQEAAWLGVKKIHGSDSSPKAVKDSQENLRWLLKEFPVIQTDIEILRSDANATSVRPTVIVTEPYLGKPLRGSEPQALLERQARELSDLYQKTFEHWATTLKPGGRVVMIWPEFSYKEKIIDIDLDQELASLGFESQPLLTPELAAALKHEDPSVLVYGRDDAKVRRQVRLWIFKK